MNNEAKTDRNRLRDWLGGRAGKGLAGGRAPVGREVGGRRRLRVRGCGPIGPIPGGALEGDGAGRRA